MDADYRMKRFTSLLLLSLCLVPCANGTAGFLSMSLWKGEGNALDSGYDPHHGVLVGGTTFAPGADGQAFSLDGVDDEIRITNALSYFFSNSVSVAGWLVTTGANDFAGLVDHFVQAAQTTGFQVSMSGNNGFPPNRAGILRADLGVGATYATAYNERRIDDGLSHHFVLTYDGEQAILYIDGVPGTPVVITNWVPPTAEEILLGADSAASARHFKGLLDEVAIFPWALPPFQVRDLFEALHPRLRIARVWPASITVSWSGQAEGFRLQAQTTMGSSWVGIDAQPNNSASLPTLGPHRFFRLIKP
jgi:hypothetical protein